MKYCACDTAIENDMQCCEHCLAYYIEEFGKVFCEVYSNEFLEFDNQEQRVKDFCLAYQSCFLDLLSKIGEFEPPYILTSEQLAQIFEGDVIDAKIDAKKMVLWEKGER